MPAPGTLGAGNSLKKLTAGAESRAAHGLYAPQPPALTEQIHQDLLALVRTLKMHQIEGASGYQHLKADLEERWLEVAGSLER